MQFTTPKDSPSALFPMIIGQLAGEYAFCQQDMLKCISGRDISKIILNTETKKISFLKSPCFLSEILPCLATLHS